MNWKNILWISIVCFASFGQLQAQAVLYGGIIQNKGYVVGAPLADAGFQRFDGDTTWVHIGHKNPRVNGVAFHPTNEDIIFLAAGNGALRSLNNGKTWRIASDWHVTEGQDIQVDQNAPDHVYIATAYGVWRSEDMGATWIESNTNITRKYCQTIEMDHTTAHRLFAGTESGIYRSTNGAKTWTRVSPIEIEVHDLEQSKSNPNVWLAGAEKGGVMVSTDNGSTWEVVQGAIAGQSIYGVAINPTNENVMAATGWDAGVWLSNDKGKTWKQIGQNLPTKNNYEAIFDVNDSQYLIIATVEKGIFKTRNEGNSWEYLGGYGTLVFDLTYKN